MRCSAVIYGRFCSNLLYTNKVLGIIIFISHIKELFLCRMYANNAFGKNVGELEGDASLDKCCTIERL